eukprot:15211-Heterococcus_DN1.PRE.3
MSSLRSDLQSIRSSSSSSSRSSRRPQLHMAVKPSTKTAAADVSTETTTSAKLLTNADNLRLSTKQVSSGVIKQAAAGAAAQGVQGVQVGLLLAVSVLQTVLLGVQSEGETL